MYSNISCFWETQPEGCRRISCAFYHNKPRHINGLFWPSSNTLLQNQESISLPIHPPLVINLSDEPDEDDDEEDANHVSDWVPKTAEDIEEERAIKEICYKSGEYYRIHHPHEHQSTKTVSSSQENKPLPLEDTKQDLKSGDGSTVPTKSDNMEGGEECSKRSAPAENTPRTDCRTYANGGTHTSGPKVKPKYQPRDQRMDRSGSSSPYVRETERNNYFRSSEHQRAAYVVHRTVNVTQKPKFSRFTVVPEPYGGKCSNPKNCLKTNRRYGTRMENYDKYTSESFNPRTWRKRNPHTEEFSKFKTTIQGTREKPKETEDV